MLAHVHPLACVSPNSTLGTGTRVGPFAVIEDDVELGPECVVESHAVIKQGTRLGARNHVGEGTILGGVPQHTAPPAEIGRVIIGSGNTFREHVTVHKAMHGGHETIIGDHNFLMVNSHVAHDCVLGNHIILANNVMLAGHVTVDDRAYLGGAAGVHQFCRIGKLTMVGGQARVTKDVPPYVMVDGESSCIVGLNLVGLKRSGHTSEQIAELKEAYRFIYRTGMLWSEMLEELPRHYSEGAPAAFTEFFAGGKRGFTPERRGPASRAILPLPQRDEEAPPGQLRKVG